MGRGPRLWAALAWTYGLLLAFGVFFIGPFAMGFLASLKTNPLEWPFSLQFAQVNPKNWLAAWRLGQEGGRNPWLGGMAPGREVVLEVAYFSPEGHEPPFSPKSLVGSRVQVWGRSLKPLTPRTMFAWRSPCLWG